MTEVFFMGVCAGALAVIAGYLLCLLANPPRVEVVWRRERPWTPADTPHAPVEVSDQ